MAESEKAESGSLTSLSGVVPSLYYDLIARVAPGLVFLLCLDDTQAYLKDHRDGLTGTLLLALGYVVGLLLTPFYEIFIAPLWLLTRIKSVRQRVGLPDHDSRSGNDVVGLQRPDYGATLGKMQAESVLCANLASGLVILRFLPLHSFFSPAAAGAYSPGLSCTVFTWLLIFLIVATNYRYGMWMGRQAQVIALIKQLPPVAVPIQPAPAAESKPPVS
jgi:hypothetical protein